MASQADVRRISLSLSGVREAPDRFAFTASNGKKEVSLAWVWLERIHPKKARVPQPAVLAVRVAGESDKHALLAMDDAKFFTEPHYDGYPAVLVRLAAVRVPELRALLEAAHAAAITPPSRAKRASRPRAK